MTLFIRRAELKRPILYGAGIGFILASSALAFAFALDGSSGTPVGVKYLPAVFSFAGVALIVVGGPRAPCAEQRTRQHTPPNGPPQPTSGGDTRPAGAVHSGPAARG